MNVQAVRTNFMEKPFVGERLLANDQFVCVGSDMSSDAKRAFATKPLAMPGSVANAKPVSGVLAELALCHERW